MTSKFIYKICAASEWEDAVRNGVFEGSAIDLKDGFIHFSTAEQSVETASKHFSGTEGLVLVKIDGDSLGSALKWEKSRNDALFPHLYATLDPGTAVSVVDLPLDDNGSHIFPPMD